MIAIAGGQRYPGPLWQFTTQRYPDFDADGDIDLSDYAHLQICMTGPDRLVDPACTDASLNGDDRVDEADLLLFLACLSGAGRPSELNCAN